MRRSPKRRSPKRRCPSSVRSLDSRTAAGKESKKVGNRKDYSADFRSSFASELQSESNSDASELRRHVQETGACERISQDNRDEELARERFAKGIVQSGRESSVSRTIIYREDALAV